MKLVRQARLGKRRESIEVRPAPGLRHLIWLTQHVLK